MKKVKTKKVVITTTTIPYWAVRLAARYPMSGPQSEPTRLIFATNAGIGYHNKFGERIPIGVATEFS